MRYKDLYNSKDKNYYSNSRNEILPYVPSNIKTVLDIGCAAGSFGKLLKEKYGCIVYGVEPNKEAAKEAAKKIDFVINDVFDGSLDLEDELFDCIFFNDVLEHLIDPLAALNFAKRKLIKNGRIVASIPNLRHFNVIWDLIVKKDFEYVNAGILDNTHLRFFTMKSIERLFENSGLEIEKIEGINSEYGRKYKLLNFLLFNHLQDMRYIQFVVVAKK